MGKFDNIKAKLKKIPALYDTVALVKARSTKRRIASLLRHYDDLARERNQQVEREYVSTLLRQRLASRGATLQRKRQGQLHLFWVGASYAQDYSGFMQALKTFGNVTEFWSSPSHYGLRTSPTFDPDVRRQNSRALIEQVRKAHDDNPIDVLIGQMWSNFLDPSALDDIRRLGIATINIAMDDRLPDLWSSVNGELMGSIGLSNSLDLVLNTSPECCVRYLLRGCPCLYWPLASNPEIFFPAETKDINVCFVGSNYGIRKRIIQSLQRAGITVDTYGPGWPNGPLDAEGVARVFSRSKIILGIGTIAHCRDVYTLKLRDFDATMAGALYITHRNPDLAEIFEEGKHIEYYESESELIGKIRFYLSNPDKVESIGAAGALQSATFHTWEKRLSEAFELLGIGENDD